jgi:hypothetical protein
MKMIIQAAVVTLAISTQLASAQPVRWETYSIPETGTSVDFPASIFTEQAGRPPDGYGRRFQSADGRADFTIEAAAISSSVSPAAFLATMHPPPRIQYKRVTSRFFVVSSYKGDKANAFFPGRPTGEVALLKSLQAMPTYRLPSAISCRAARASRQATKL